MSGTSPRKNRNWIRPSDVMVLHRFRIKKNALQARLTSSNAKENLQKNVEDKPEPDRGLGNIPEKFSKRNPFVKTEVKKQRIELVSEESSDTSALYNLLHQPPIPSFQTQSLTFSEALQNCNKAVCDIKNTAVQGESWIPVDWTLKSKGRFISTKQFEWKKILKTSEEASGITGATRCLDPASSETSLDTSPNAKFHQCCLYWQQPSLPWLQLFPRTRKSVTAEPPLNIALYPSIKDSLYQDYCWSLKSLFNMVRARQCPYFYVCANNFTALFRAAGICGHSDIHAMLTPTTRGFRQVLKQEEIIYTMPLKAKRKSGGENDLSESMSQFSEEIDGSILEEHDSEEENEEQWLESLGIKAEDIKSINYNQDRINRKRESEVDSCESSLIYVEGIEAQALYNFLMNCKSAVPQTGPFAGVPPTLLAPVAFRGATLKPLKVQQTKITQDNTQFFCIELQGPILPSAIHNLCSVHTKDASFTATFSNVMSTAAFNKVQPNPSSEPDVANNPLSETVFGYKNLSDCGLSANILKHFCAPNLSERRSIESLKYALETNSYSCT